MGRVQNRAHAALLHLFTQELLRGECLSIVHCHLLRQLARREGGVIVDIRLRDMKVRERLVNALRAWLQGPGLNASNEAVTEKWLQLIKKHLEKNNKALETQKVKNNLALQKEKAKYEQAVKKTESMLNKILWDAVYLESEDSKVTDINKCKVGRQLRARISKK